MSGRLPVVIRQSNIDQSKCLYRFKKIQILGIREPQSEFALRGTDFHLMAKRYVDFLVATQQPTDWSYADSLVETEVWHDEAIALFRPWSRAAIIDPSVVYGTEFKVRLNIDCEPCDQSDAVYSGDFDRLEVNGNSAVIHDFKTNFAIHQPLTTQSVFYAWLLWKIMPHLEDVTFRLEFVRYSAIRERQFTTEHLEQMERWVRNQVARLRTAFELDEWPAMVNAGCTFCRLECPLVQQGISAEQIGQVGSAGQARAMASQLYALKRTAAHLQAMLRSYAVENGPIDLGNEISLGFEKQTMTEYDARTVLKLNEEHGFKPERGLRVNGKDVAKTGKTYPEFLIRARKTAKDASRTVFQFSSRTGDPLEAEDEEGFD